MFIVNKKKILFIEISLIIGITFASIVTFNTGYQNKENVVKVTLNSNNKSKDDIVQVSTTPVTQHIVVLDAGHGTPDEGAENSDGLTEAETNLKIVLKLQKILEASNCNVILTRSDENGIYNLDSKSLKEMKISDMKNRVKIGNNTNADIFISIHLNKIDIESCYGWQTFYKKGSEEGKSLSNFIQTNLNQTIQIENKRVPQEISGKYIIENVQIPTVIVECGFISNEEEASKLQTDEYQEKIAWGIYTGILDYFSE
jgi:N-acetylmuramoyl-L-alanine amidase